MSLSEQGWLDIFGDNLKWLLEDKNTTRQELSEWAGLTKGTISKIINKKQMPDIFSIINIANALDEDYEDLLYFEDDVR